jgi:uncharacterized Fe-S center protein
LAQAVSEFGEAEMQHFRGYVYCQDDVGHLSAADTVDIDAATFDEAARKLTGGGVTERGARHKLAAKVWDRNGNAKIYYRE